MGVREGLSAYDRFVGVVVNHVTFIGIVMGTLAVVATVWGTYASPTLAHFAPISYVMAKSSGRS